MIPFSVQDARQPAVLPVNPAQLCQRASPGTVFALGMGTSAEADGNCAPGRLKVTAADNDAGIVECVSMCVPIPLGQSICDSNV